MYNWFNYSRIKRQLENQLEENARLKGENKTLEDILKAIQEDGTTEHNNAINLRQSVAHLREEAEKFYNENVQLTKEVRDLRHLKTENVELIERLLQKEGSSYGITFNKAKTQIIQNDYKKCAEERDEYKHQLDAANKEIEALKSKLRNCQDRYAQSFSYNDMDKLQKEIDKLKAQKHPSYPLHWGGYDKNIIDLVESELNNGDPVEGERVCTWCYKCQHIKEQCKCDKYLNIQDLPKTFPNEFQEPTWEEAASDLALKLVKLEKKIQDLTRLPKN
jgi:hypothetical protein